MKGKRSVVAYKNCGLCYSNSAPFDPSIPYPEYPFHSDNICLDNHVYGAVREVLKYAGLDKNHFNTPHWNPLKDLVGEGQTVLIKPNWVRDYHLHGEDLFSIVTHPSVLRPLIDYAFKAVGMSGKIWIMDAPLWDTDFDTLIKVCQLDKMGKILRSRGVPLIIADLRSLITKIDKGVVVKRINRNTWDSEGIEFDLEMNSEFVELGESLQNVFGSDYDRRVTRCFHSINKSGQQRHCYRISRRVIDANLVISVPKLKTHKKTGVSLNLKNMIGINTDKNYIPHYRVGAPSKGGDEFPDTNDILKKSRRWLVRHFIDLLLGKSGHMGEMIVHNFMNVWIPPHKKKLEKKAGHQLDPVDIFYRTVQGDSLRTGNWWGNDTCWRCGVDINKILIYGTAEGYLSDKPVRKYFSVIDGIVGGEGDGPLAATPRSDGVLISGFDPVSVDEVAIRVMGFNPNLFRDIRCSRQIEHYPLTNSDLPTVTCSNLREWNENIKPTASLNFCPHDSWSQYLLD